MKKVVFIAALAFCMISSKAQIASNNGLDHQHWLDSKFRFHELSSLNDEMDHRNTAENESIEAAGLKVVKKVVKGQADHKDILNEVYSDPTLGKMIKDEDDVWRYLGFTAIDFKRLEHYLSLL